MSIILITGGAGFIGSSLAERAISDPDNQVVIVDNLSTGSLEKLPQLPKTNWRFIKCDVNDFGDISLVMHSFHFEYVFHYAAVVGVKRTQENPTHVLRDIRGIENILNLSKGSGVKRVFLSSSSEVYGEPVHLPQNEDTTPLNSKIPYAVVKNVGEAYLRSYKKEYNLDYTIFRFFNTYGPKQSTDFVMSRFISLALKNEDIHIYGDGKQSRTFCFVDDNIEATYTCFQNSVKSGNGANEVINIGSDIETSILDLAKKIIELTGSRSHIVHEPPLPEGDMARRRPDISKMKKLLNRKPVKLEDGIKKILENPSFIIK
jgi:UDP-glucuronate decarboxylase